MKMTNFEIYNSAKALIEAFQDASQVLPIRVNFYIQKNRGTLVALAQDIDETRMNIIRTYGTLDEENSQYVVNADKAEIASKELEDLFSLEQEVNIYKVGIEKFPEDISLTAGQMEALMFMIE